MERGVLRLAAGVNHPRDHGSARVTERHLGAHEQFCYVQRGRFDFLRWGWLKTCKLYKKLRQSNN